MLTDEQAFKLKDMARSALETGLAFGMDERVFERLALAVWAEAMRAREGWVPQWIPMADDPPEFRKELYGTLVLYCDDRGNRWTDCYPGHPSNGCGRPATHYTVVPQGPLPAAPKEPTP